MSTLALLLALSSPASATLPDASEPLFGAGSGLRLHVEFGALLPMSHRIQFSTTGSRINYIEEGGQDNLFPVARLSADLDLGRHTVIALYQPLDLRSTELLDRDLTIDELVFPADTAVDFRYGFDFFRLSWLYDLQQADDRELALGVSLQLRNATISFTSLNGELFRTNRDLGPVPILKVRTRQPIGERTWLGAEADGFWAPIRYINGSNSDVEGAILDASVRAGLDVGAGDVFLNLRYLGGGAVGTESNPTGPGDGYVDNWLHFVTLTLGATLR